MHTITRTAGSAALDVEQVKKDATWMAESIQASIDEINKELIDSTTIGRLHNVMALAHAYSQGNPYAEADEPTPSESSMWLVYADTEGGKHYQPWQDLEESGTLIDPETGEDMEMIGWTTNGFQYEIAFVSLGLGFGCLYASQHGPEAWIAVSLPVISFLFLAGVNHVVGMIRERNFAPGNSLICIYDFGVAISLAVLLFTSNAV
jgi:hypothetical protein